MDVNREKAIDLAVSQIERVLGVDVGADAAALLRFGDDVKR